jgi:poly(A) polymerase
VASPSHPSPRSVPGDNARLAAVGIVQLLQSQGHVAYFAGGCVRDEVLGLTPSDFDVATDATPERLLALFRNTREVGAHFGVVHVHAMGHVVEVATFRTEGPYSDHRRPDSVRFAGPQDDAKRRDFTINALFLDPLASPDKDQAASPLGGAVIDLVGGLADLRDRVLRAVGDPHLRLGEDHLRALRAVRLAAKLGFTVEPRTADAIQSEASRLAGVSRERIGDEVRRMLDHPRRAEAMILLRDLCLDGPVLTEPAQPAHGVGVLASLPHDAPVSLSLAAWAIDRAGEPPESSAIFSLLRRWRPALCLSNDEAEAFKGYLTCLGALRTDWSDWGTQGIAPRKRLASRSGFGGAVRLLGALDQPAAGRVASDVEQLAATRSGLDPAPWVSGDDLIALGQTPGPAFKALLDRLYDAQLEDRVGSREEALELARGWCV